MNAHPAGRARDHIGDEASKDKNGLLIDVPPSNHGDGLVVFGFDFLEKIFDSTRFG